MMFDDLNLEFFRFPRIYSLSNDVQLSLYAVLVVVCFIEFHSICESETCNHNHNHNQL